MKKIIIKMLAPTTILVPAMVLVSCGESSSSTADKQNNLAEVSQKDIINSIKKFRENIDDSAAPNDDVKAIHICLKAFDSLYANQTTDLKSERGEVTFYYEGGTWRTSHSLDFARALKAKFGMSNISLKADQIDPGGAKTQKDSSIQKVLLPTRLREILQTFETKIEDGTITLELGDRIVVNGNKLDKPEYEESDGTVVPQPNYLDTDESLGQSEVKLNKIISK